MLNLWNVVDCNRKKVNDNVILWAVVEKCLDQASRLKFTDDVYYYVQDVYRKGKLVITE